MSEKNEDLLHEDLRRLIDMTSKKIKTPGYRDGSRLSVLFTFPEVLSSILSTYMVAHGYL